jgi:hypothetical protein
LKNKGFCVAENLAVAIGALGNTYLSLNNNKNNEGKF